MLKSEAVARWGSEAVELARDYYETDFNKILFTEDCTDPEDYAASEEDVIERCSRAHRNLNNIPTVTVMLEYCFTDGGTITRYISEDAVNADIEMNFNSVPAEWVESSLHPSIKIAIIEGTTVRKFPKISADTLELIKDFRRMFETPTVADYVLTQALNGNTTEQIKALISSRIGE